MGFSDSLKQCWKSMYSCMFPCFNKSKDDTEKMPLRTVWEDWETYRDWQDFTPHPGDPKWDQLPESIKSTVKRTSEELGRYASAKKSSFGIEKVPLLRKT